MKNDINKIQQRLKLNTFKLESLLDITKAINNNLPKEKLFVLFEQILKEQLHIGKLALYSYSGSWKCVVKYGEHVKTAPIVVEKHLKPFMDISYVNNVEVLKPFDIVIPVFHKKQALAYVLIGDFEEERIEISPTIKHLPFIQTLTNIIAVAIENKRLAKESVKQQAIKKELELAKEVQSMLFPEHLPVSKELEVAAFYQPHDEVGGDYYDFIHLNEQEVAFCVADVSGKGISAALLMSNFQANLRALISRTDSLTELVQELNKKVMLSAKGDRFITFFIAKYNLQTRVLNYINAAHLPPLLFKGNKVEQMRVGCIGLGMMDELPNVCESFIILPPEALLFLFTDGVNELRNDKGEEYGLGNIIRFINKNRSVSLNELNQSLYRDLNKFKGKQRTTDDVTLFSCRIF